MQRDTGNVESITVEYGFLDSTGDDVEQLKNNWKKYAEAVVRAILSYTGKNTSDEYYVVQKGDSLWSIAKKFNISVEKLKELNNLNSNLLNIGKTLKIKESNTNIDTTDTDSNNYYIVKKGDNLWSIARLNNTTVAKIKELNNLTSNNLSIGQKLKLSDSNNYYIVKKGDNLWNIARLNNTTVAKIKELNNLTSNNLSIGQKLKIS